MRLRPLDKAQGGRGMKIIDISWPITENTTGYKNRKNIKFTRYKNFETDGWRESLITLESHSGTHIDAPSHFVRDGKNIESISLDRLVGDCIVLDLTDVQESGSPFDENGAKSITRDILFEHDHEINKDDIIILKTSNSATKPEDLFLPNFVYLDHSGAHYLAQKGVKAVGIDYLGIERNQPGHETHIELMQNNIVIIEGLRLQHVQAGNYFFCCLPLAIQGLEAAPARAVLIDDNL